MRELFVPRARNAGLAVALVSAGAGVLQQSPTLFLAAAVGLVYAAWDVATGTPRAELTVVRSIGTTRPSPGDLVEVTLTVRNVGAAPLPDLRVVDGVPSALRVERGSPRIAAALQSGETTTTTYAIRARPGEHVYDPVVVESRSLTGGPPDRVTTSLDDAISCERPVPAIDADGATRHVGRSSTERPGAGQAFYGVREYRRPDPLGRIDWRRFARTGDLATVEFESPRASSVVIVVDDRHDFARDETVPTARELTGAATTQLARALLDVHDSVGAVSLARQAVVEPAAGRSQYQRIRQLVDSGAGAHADGKPTADETASSAAADDGAETPADAAETAGSPDVTIGTPLRSTTATDGGTAADPPVDAIHRSIPESAHVVLCSPLLDRYSRVLARGLAERGRAVTVISPDVTGKPTDETAASSGAASPSPDAASASSAATSPSPDGTPPSPGAVAARLTRADRLERLRPHVRLINWSPDEEFAMAIARAKAGWSA